MTDDDSWRYETMADLAKDSPYYDELNERCPDCGGRIGYSACTARADDYIYNDYYGPDNDPDDDDAEDDE